MLLVHGARKEVTMENTGEYLKPIAEAADSEENFLGLVQSRFKEAKTTIAEVTSEGPDVALGVQSYSLCSSSNLERRVDEDESENSRS
jgi:hypothetical protein